MTAIEANSEYPVIVLSMGQTIKISRVKLYEADKVQEVASPFWTELHQIPSAGARMLTSVYPVLRPTGFIPCVGSEGDSARQRLVVG